MSIIIKDGVFTTDTDSTTPPLFEVSRNMTASEIADSIATSSGFLIPFPSFSDGWGFSISRALRDQGYTGHLRACGYLIPDQYPLALRSGFDDIEIPDELAHRGGESAWKNAYNRSAIHTYRDRLRQTP